MTKQKDLLDAVQASGKALINIDMALFAMEKGGSDRFWDMLSSRFFGKNKKKAPEEKAKTELSQMIDAVEALARALPKAQIALPAALAGAADSSQAGTWEAYFESKIANYFEQTNFRNKRQALMALRDDVKQVEALLEKKMTK